MVQPSEGFELNVYPNPATTQMEISLQVPQRQKVNLSAYTSDGKLIKTIVNGPVDQGIHHYQFGPGQLPGTYVLSANSPSCKIIKKVVLLN